MATARGRWRVEQDYQQLKEELGLDHFEGRSWAGWYHHVIPGAGTASTVARGLAAHNYLTR
ncbi:MAG: hypothetical protein ACJ73N_13570 [Bryobacteraceae bacterium]